MPDFTTLQGTYPQDRDYPARTFRLQALARVRPPFSVSGVADIPSVAELVERTATEYQAASACRS